MRCTVSLCSVLRSWSHLRLYFYMTWLTWAHNSMLINYDPSHLLAVLVVLEHLKEKTNSDKEDLPNSVALQSKCFNVHVTLIAAEHAHVIESGVVSSSLRRFYRVLIPQIPFPSHASLQPPQSPQFVLSLSNSPWLHLNLEVGVRQHKMCCFINNRTRPNQSLGSCNLTCTLK